MRIPKVPLFFSPAATRLSSMSITTRWLVAPGFKIPTPPAGCLETYGPLVTTYPPKITAKRRESYFTMKILGGFSAFFISIFNLYPWKDYKNDQITTDDIDLQPQEQAPTIVETQDAQDNVYLKQVTTDTGIDIQPQERTPVVMDSQDALLEEDALIQAIKLPKGDMSPEVQEFLSDLHGHPMPNPAGDFGAPYTPVHEKDVERYMKEIHGKKLVHKRYLDWKKEKSKQRLR